MHNLNSSEFWSLKYKIGQGTMHVTAPYTAVQAKICVGAYENNQSTIQENTISNTTFC